MLHYAGDITAMQLGQRAKAYIWMYEKAGAEVCLVPFQDLQKGRKRFVKFEMMAGVSDWVFLELVG